MQTSYDRNLLAQLAFEHAYIAIAVIQDGVFLTVNPAFEMLTGWTAESIKNKPVDILGLQEEEGKENITENITFADLLKQRDGRALAGVYRWQHQVGLTRFSDVTVHDF